MTITLTPEIERPLTEEAQRYGTTPELLAMDALRERFTDRIGWAAATAPNSNGVSLDIALADLLAEAEALESTPPTSDQISEFGQIISEKYRRQGFQT